MAQPEGPGPDESNDFDSGDIGVRRVTGYRICWDAMAVAALPRESEPSRWSAS